LVSRIIGPGPIVSGQRVYQELRRRSIAIDPNVEPLTLWSADVIGADSFNLVEMDTAEEQKGRDSKKA